MKKVLSITEFCDELVSRIDEKKTIDCCVEEIKNLAMIAKKEIGQKTIEVNWKED